METVANKSDDAIDVGLCPMCGENMAAFDISVEKQLLWKAAPELLAACEAFLTAYDTSQSWPSVEVVGRARIALARVRGEAVRS